MVKFLWALTAIGSVLGGLMFLLGVPAAESAPQEASVAAMAITMAAVPYCLARAVSELRALKTKEDAD